jgi:hypothetical protein
MIETLLAPVTEWLLKKRGGSDKCSAEFQHTRLAICHAIAREVRLHSWTYTTVFSKEH